MPSFLADAEPLATVEELAAFFKTGKDWIREGCRTRSLPFTWRGRAYGFTREQVEEIVRLKAVPVKTVPRRDEVAERRRTRRAA